MFVSTSETQQRIYANALKIGANSRKLAAKTDSCEDFETTMPHRQDDEQTQMVK